jgi:antitoxin VapB
MKVDTKRIYSSLEVVMPDRAKLFQSGGSQAVRLPKDYRFEGDEVLITRRGRQVILEPVRRTWSREFLALAGSAPDFPVPEEPLPAEPGPDFDA